MITPTTPNRQRRQPACTEDVPKLDLLKIGGNRMPIEKRNQCFQGFLTVTGGDNPILSNCWVNFKNKHQIPQGSL
jgi:hypothetical protein